MRLSSAISHASAIVLAAAGVLLLFASDVLLPRVVPGVTPASAWAGQLVAAAWLGLAALNWLQRRTVLGGIYGRPVVLANLVLYFVSALSLLRALIGGAAPGSLWPALVVFAVMAVAYGALLFSDPTTRATSN